MGIENQPLVAEREVVWTLPKLAVAPVARPRHNTGPLVDMPGGVYAIFIGTWAALLATFVGTFWHSPYTLYVLSVIVLYAVMFFGLPTVMARLNPAKTKQPLADFLDNHFSILGGEVLGREVLVQMVTVPAALTAGAVVISFIVGVARTHAGVG